MGQTSGPEIIAFNCKQLKKGARVMGIPHNFSTVWGGGRVSPKSDSVLLRCDVPSACLTLLIIE